MGCSSSDEFVKQVGARLSRRRIYGCSEALRYCGPRRDVKASLRTLVLDCIAPSILPPILAVIGSRGIDDLVPVLDRILSLILRLVLFLFVLVLLLFPFLLRFLLLLFSSSLSCARAISGTLNIPNPNPVTNARRLICSA